MKAAVYKLNKDKLNHRIENELIDDRFPTLPCEIHATAFGELALYTDTWYWYFSRDELERDHHIDDDGIGGVEGLYDYNYDVNWTIDEVLSLDRNGVNCDRIAILESGFDVKEILGWLDKARHLVELKERLDQIAEIQLTGHLRYLPTFGGRRIPEDEENMNAVSWDRDNVLVAGFFSYRHMPRQFRIVSREDYEAQADSYRDIPR